MKQEQERTAGTYSAADWKPGAVDPATRDAHRPDKLTCIDLFSGCGGMSLGLRRAGFEVLFCVEAHPDAFATYRHNLIGDAEAGSRSWPDWLEVRPWTAEHLLDAHRDELKALRGLVDLIAGGPPCQGFSSNGLRRPDDPRSGLVDVYLDWVDLLRPRTVLLENVAGFLTMPHREGGSYGDHARRRLAASGYACSMDVLKASDWGVPQRRPRLVLIAGLPEAIGGYDPIQLAWKARCRFLAARGLGTAPTGTASALSDLEDSGPLPWDTEWGHRGFRSLSRSAQPRSAYQALMRAGCEENPTDVRVPRHGQVTIQRMSRILNECRRGVSLSTQDRARLGIRKRTITPLHPDRPAPTLSTLPDDLIHYSRPRSLTVRECARLQSFPDWFSFTGPYTTGGRRRVDSCPRYTQVGNAVAPLLAEALGESLSQILRR